MTMIFYGVIIFPFAFFISGKKYYEKKNIIIIIINSILTLLLFIIALIFNLSILNESISLGYLFFTPFLIIWIILLVISIKFYNVK